MISFIVLLVFIFISRAIGEKANKQLDQSKKAELIDLFSKSRIYTFGTLIVIILFFFASIRFQLIDPVITFVIYIILVLGYFIVVAILSYRKLKQNNFPDSYIKLYLITTTLRLFGLVVFFLILNYQ